jgi:hypothetical protein
MTKRKILPDVDPPESAESAYERGVAEERQRWQVRMQQLAEWLDKDGPWPSPDDVLAKLCQLVGLLPEDKG